MSTPAVMRSWECHESRYPHPSRPAPCGFLRSTGCRGKARVDPGHALSVHRGSIPGFSPGFVAAGTTVTNPGLEGKVRIYSLSDEKEVRRLVPVPLQAQWRSF